MYHLKCPYYKKKFETIYELLDDMILYYQEWILTILSTRMVRVLGLKLLI